jgi:hypothetical protein
MSNTNKPAAKINDFFPITAAIWKNTHTNTEGKTFNRYSVSLERHYKDEMGNWKSTGTFNGDELLTVAKLADLAHTEISKLRSTDRQQENREPGEEG